MARDAPGEGSFVERRIRRIANARSVTVGLAVTFIGTAILGGIIIHFADESTFGSTWLGVWWALQTVTTVGYGDVVPHGAFGKSIGAVEMVLGVAFITFVTAGVTSTVIQRGERAERDADREQLEKYVQQIVEALADTRQAIADLESRLDRADSRGS